MQRGRKKLKTSKHILKRKKALYLERKDKRMCVACGKIPAEPAEGGRTVLCEDCKLKRAAVRNRLRSDSERAHGHSAILDIGERIRYARDPLHHRRDAHDYPPDPASQSQTPPVQTHTPLQWDVIRILLLTRDLSYLSNLKLRREFTNLCAKFRASTVEDVAEVFERKQQVVLDNEARYKVSNMLKVLAKTEFRN